MNGQGINYKDKFPQWQHCLWLHALVAPYMFYMICMLGIFQKGYMEDQW